MNEDDKKKHLDLASKLISEQNFAAAIIAGAVATLLAAVAYGIIVVRWPFAYGFAAAGVGFLIGLPMGFLGRGISTRFAVAAALFTIAGCTLGNLFRVVLELARAPGASLIDVFRNNALPMLAERVIRNISFIDLVFWFVAVVCAVFLARRPLSRSDRLAIGLYEIHR